MSKETQIKLFEESKIRSVWNEEEQQWYFSVVDVVAVLTESPTPRQYWGKIKDREFIKLQLSPIWVQLKMQSSDGKFYNTDAANVKALLRIIQSIPSPKAEPFKQWLAQVGYERILEIENPELAQERMKELYEKKGYPKDWIDKRLRGMAIRQNLTDEWKERGITKESDYAILTAEISKATFGLTPSKYKELKGLTKKNQNLRDHMTDLELIFTMLGERVTTEISQQEKPDTFEKNKTNAYVTGDTTKSSAPIYRFEPDKNDNEGRVRFTDVSEVLSITVDASINHAERLSQITAMVLTKRVADEDRIKAAVNKGYIELPEAFTFTESETKIYDMIYDTSSDYFHDKEFKELTVGRNLSFSYDIAFKWGSFFEHKNPSIYFDEEGSSIPMGDDSSAAGSNTVRGILKELRALLNGIELNLWLTAK